MIYKVFFTENGTPKTGLAPTWSSLRTPGGTDKLSSAPAIAEIGGGWYRFELRYGTAPLDVPELVGVIDGGSALTGFERYVPVAMGLRDLALAKLVNKASYALDLGVEAIRDDTDSFDELRLTLSQTDDVEYRTPA